MVKSFTFMVLGIDYKFRYNIAITVKRYCLNACQACTTLLLTARTFIVQRL
ncbi:hypothetical protein JCM18902_1192 [Psychrobacter sp. JCM 18902]|nr:hypothetical protein JCM18902_1192 [Psychrobacter sp. JCM 18902]